MVDSTYEDAKQRRLQKKQEEELNANSNSNYSPDFVPIQWMGLEKGKESVFRIVGKPYEASKKEGTDVQVILFSEILNDDENGFVKINWPFVEKGEKFVPDPNWIFTKLYKKVTEGSWEKYTEEHIDGENVVKKPDGRIVGKYGKKELEVYMNHKHKNTKSFQRLSDRNNRRENDKYPRRVYPTPRVLMNVIDRHDDWCKENKHTKMLSSKVSPFILKNDSGEEQTLYYIDRGVPMVIYDALWENVVNHRGSWDDLDIVIKKTDKDRADYIVRDAKEDKISKESKELASIDPLTEEELEYELYNIADIFKPTSYFKLSRDLGRLFMLVDTELGTNFTKELNDLVMEEQAEREANEDSIETSQQESDTSKEESVDIEEKDVQEQKEKVERKTRAPKEDKKSESVDIKTISNWEVLDKEDQEDIKKKMEHFDGEIVTWKEDVDLLPCDNCQKDLPNTVLQCPYCGTKFE